LILIKSNSLLKILNIIIFFFIFFGIFNSLILDISWDEQFHYDLGKNTFNYLTSFGSIFENIKGSEFSSKIYWTIQYIFTLFFPKNYSLQINHLFNFFFSVAAIIGFVKFFEQFFFKQKILSSIIFIIIFIYPVIFGHLSINPKDTIVFFAHSWCSYLLIRYLKKKKEEIHYKFIFFFSLIFSIGTGIQFFFIGTLVPIFIYIFFNTFFFKKKIFVKEIFSLNFLIEIIYTFFLILFFIILFWPETHKNIINLPFEYLLNNFSIRGYPYSLINGEIFFLNQPNYYFYIFFFFHSPEFIIFLYVISLTYFIVKYIFFLKKIQKYYNEILFIFLIFIYPFLIVFFFKIKPYDSIRLFIWIIPYFLIIPASCLFFLINNKNMFVKKIFFLCFIFKIVYLYNFFFITPYSYSYFNFFAGSNKDKHKKFEVDYWSLSLGELIKNINFHDKSLKIASCGFQPELGQMYFKKYHNKYIKFSSYYEKDTSFALIINRVSNFNGNHMTCDEMLPGDDLFIVSRNGQFFSSFRKLNKASN